MTIYRMDKIQKDMKLFEWYCPISPEEACLHITQALVTGIKLRDPKILDFVNVLLSVGENLKAEFPKIAEQVRHLVIQAKREGRL